MTTITESQWVDHFGFQRFPFDRPEAGNEEFARPDFLASCFVEPRGFERVFGQADSPVTSLLFAARGTGKTACRVMMDYYCQVGLARLSSLNLDGANYVLSVPHLHLDNVRHIARQTASSEVLVEHHVIEILRQTVPAFVDMMAKNTELLHNFKNLQKSDFDDLSLFIIVYSAYLSSYQKDFIRVMGVKTPSSDEPKKGFIGQTSTLKHRLDWESAFYQQRFEASPLEHLKLWSKLITKVGIKSTYVLVDGVDEIMESAGDPGYAYTLIRPLLTHLRLMDETPYLAFKFFLPYDVEQSVISDSAFRWDRGFVIQRIEWREEDLVNILRKRLAALSKADHGIRDQTAVSFDALCVPELRGVIESDLVRNANGNPRYLMNLCAQMVTAHCSHEINAQDNPFELNRDDFLYAVKQVVSIYRRIAIHRKLQEGEVLHNRYKVEKIINTSHSQIIKAWDVSLKRFVAIKSPNVNQFNLEKSLVEKLYKNLRREAELLAKLHHQNIGQVFDVLEEPFVIIMEWIDGRSLHEILEKKERLPIREIIMVGVGVADALAYAHDFGVVHRDINPKNIILTIDKTPKLVDFDVAKDEILETITMREDGTRFLVGTPRYCSPEQLLQPDEISLSEIGPASDIFSLGVVLFELLTFKRPYEYGNRLAQYDNKVFPKPQPYDIPAPLYKILLKMLDGKPSNRPIAAALKRELQDYAQTQILTE